jgi:NAD(P)-dependent dehydrogenase (short-subunit alcohol dehydrogenase family)
MSAFPLLHQKSVVLVSGGGRGITARCVIRLAEQSHAHFILVGRSPVSEPDPAWAVDDMPESEAKKFLFADLCAAGQKPSPAALQKAYKDLAARQEIRHTLADIRSAGGEAEYLSVDISDTAALKSSLHEVTRRTGPVTGMIHGAGSLADKLIEKKTAKDYQTVFSPKVNGLQSMLASVSPGNLDFLVLFSSIVGVFGNVGQADYAIANEVLNKSAYLIKREHPECHVVSMNWGPWDCGMVTPELKRAFEDRGVQVISANQGVDLLMRELMVPHRSPVQVVIGTRPMLPAPEPEATLRSFRIRRRLRLEENPFLYDHVIGDHPVLPATCAAMWIVSSCEQLYPGYAFHKLEDFRVLKGIVFDGSLADEYVLDLKETAKNGLIAFEATLSSQNAKGRTLYHYSTRVTLARHLPVTPLVDPIEVVLPAAEAAIAGDELYRNGTLFHGPSFQGVQRVLSLSPDRLTMECSLDRVADRTQGQFPVQTTNPYIYDTIVQCLLIWSQYKVQAPCLPSSLERLEQYHEVPFGKRFYVSLQVVSVTDTAVVGDILVQDEQGEVYLRFTHLQGTISPMLNRLLKK